MGSTKRERRTAIGAPPPAFCTVLPPFHAKAAISLVCHGFGGCLRGGNSYCHFTPTGDGLFATTALVMTAGVAAAEVSLSGNGRMGVTYEGQAGTTGNSLNFYSRARVVFTLSGQTDGGLDFGASFRADNAANGADDGNAGNIWISGAFGKIAMGDVDSAPEALFGNLASIGFLGDDQTTFNGGTNNIPYLRDLVNPLATNNPNLLYTYSAGAFSVAASLSDGKVGLTSVDDDLVYALAGAYTFGNYTVGLGYEVLDYAAVGVKSTKQVELAGVATFGNTNVKAYYADQQDGIADNAYGIGVSSKFGATTINGYVQHVNGVLAVDDVTWYGIGADYDLGGGAVLSGGIQDDDVTGSDMVANVGINFSF